MKKLVLAAGLVVSLFSQGWAAPFVYPDAWAERKEVPVYGGVMRSPQLEAFSTYNPFTASYNYSVYNRLHPDGLMVLDPISGDFVPYMAQSYQFSKDKRSITFNLRSGMLWSDGQPVTADDFVIAHRIHSDEKSPTGYRDWWITNDKPMVVRRVTDLQLVVEFAAPRADAFEMIGFVPAPSHIFKPAYDQSGWAGVIELWNLNTDPKEILSYGAFSVVSNSVERLSLTRNVNFGNWNLDKKGRNLPYLAGRVFIRYAQSAAAEVAFMVGDLDHVSLRNADAVASVLGVIRNSKRPMTVDTKGTPADQTAFMAFNAASSDFMGRIFANTAFRKAMSHLSNKKAMLDLVFGGLGTTLNAPVNPTNQAWLAPNLPTYGFDPKAALKLLEGLGFKRGADGVLAIGKNRLMFDLHVSTEAVAERMAIIFRDEAKKIGVRVNLKVVDQGTLVNALETKKFQAILIGFAGASLSMPVHAFLRCGDFYRLFREKCVEPWEFEIDKLFQKSDLEFDQAKRREIGFEIQKIAVQYQMYNYLAISNVHFAWVNRLQGMYPSKIRNGLTGFGHLALYSFR